MNVNVIHEIDQIGYEVLWSILMAHAVMLMKSKDRVVKGSQAADLVCEVIDFELEHDWDKSQGEFITYLKKKIYNAYRRTYRNLEGASGSKQDINVVANFVSVSQDIPDNIMEGWQSIEEMYEIVRAKRSGENDNIEDVLKYMEEGWQNVDIAELLDIPVSDVVNYKKRIIRYLKDKNPNKKKNAKR